MLSSNKISIVTTLYNSAAFIQEFYQRMTAVVTQFTDDYEIIVVDDGSPDHSGKIVKEIVAKDPRVTLIELSRNFGHHYAEVAGLAQARGELVFLIDSDLEEQPEWLSDFMRIIKDDEVDVVFGVQGSRTGSAFKKLSGELFYRLFNLVSETKIPINLCTVRLMTREYVDSLLTLQDKNIFLAGNCAWAGFKQQSVVVQKIQTRTQSNYSMQRKISLFVNAITSFSSYPLKLVFFIGIVMSILSGAIGLRMIIEKILNPEGILLGYPSIMVSIWFLGGLIILFVGVIGLYLSKIFIEVKPRPQYIIRRIYKRSN